MGKHQLLSQSLNTTLSSSSRHAFISRIYTRLQVGSALGLCVGFLLTFSIITKILGGHSSRFTDFFYRAPTATGQVVLVTLDPLSNQQPELTWSRTNLARLMESVAAAEPRVIGLNLFLVDSTADDAALAQAMRHAATVVQPIVGIDFTRSYVPANALPHFGVALAPAPTLQTQNTKLGHTLITPDDDGIVRRLPLVVEANGRRDPALGIAVLEAYLGQTFDANAYRLGAEALPVDSSGRLLLNFFSRSTRPTISAFGIIRNNANPSELRGKIVLIGFTGSAETLHFTTPTMMHAEANALSLQADLIETILSRFTLRPQDQLTQIVMVFLLALLAGATLPHFRFLPAIGLTLIYVLLYIGYAFAEFEQGVVVQPIYPMLALGLTLVGAIIYRYFSEERRREYMTSLMRRYLAPDDVAQTTDKFDLNTLLLRGTRREVSVLAIDLSELEPLASSLTAEGMVEWLNNYAALMLPLIFQHGGSVVKQTGSAILAAWNLLIDQPDHAPAAVRAAINIRHAVAEFNYRHPKELTIRTGMGIATGSVIAGRLGTSAHAEYTIIGEIVGMAERIALKPERGVFIDHTTRDRLGEEFDMLEVKPVRLRRQSDPAQVWLLIETTETQDQISETPVAEPPK